MLSAIASCLAVGFIATYPDLQMASGLLTENARLAEQLEWYETIHRDKPPLIVVGPWQ